MRTARGFMGQDTLLWGGSWSGPCMGQGAPQTSTAEKAPPVPKPVEPTGPPRGFAGCDPLATGPDAEARARALGLEIKVDGRGLMWVCPPKRGTERAEAEGPEKAEDRVERICRMLAKFSESEAGGPEESDARSRIFWSYVRQHAGKTGRGEDAVAQEIQARCPGAQVPAKAPQAAVPPKPPESEGFHGKTALTRDEASDLADVLAAVLTPLSPEDAAKEIAREECLRDVVRADGFPVVDRLRERLNEFVAKAKPSDTFEISKDEAAMTGKAVECAEAIRRARTVRTVAYAGGAAAGGVGLLWLVGVL